MISHTLYGLYKTRTGSRHCSLFRLRVLSFGSPRRIVAVRETGTALGCTYIGCKLHVAFPARRSDRSFGNVGIIISRDVKLRGCLVRHTRQQALCTKSRRRRHGSPKMSNNGVALTTVPWLAHGIGSGSIGINCEFRRLGFRTRTCNNFIIQ